MIIVVRMICSVGNGRCTRRCGGNHGFTRSTCFRGRLSSSTLLLLLLMIDWTERRATTAACISRHVVDDGGDDDDDDGVLCYLVWKLVVRVIM